MRKMLVCLAVSCCLGLDVAAGAAKPVDLKSLPVNEWVKLPVRARMRGYEYTQLVYAPSRGRLFHWGAIRRIYRVPNVFRNDVRAFDANAGGWVSDYPSDKSPKDAAAKGRPGMGVVVNGICYDSRRKRVMTSTWAYDTAARTWHDLKAKTILYGREYAGAPPVGGAGMCYDPVNDEVVMFPHYGNGTGPVNTDQLDVDGRISNHLGTLRFSFKDNTWRRVGHTFGSDEVRAARKAVLGLAKSASTAFDRIWALRRRPDKAGAAAVADKLDAVAADIKRLEAGKWAEHEQTESAPGLSWVRDRLRKAAASVRSGKMTKALDWGASALRVLEFDLEVRYRVEPPPRCAAPMVYHPKRQAIIMFGGHNGRVRVDLVPPHHLGGRPGALNDTWLYDCKTRGWREIRCSRRPPKDVWPRMIYDPKSGLVLLAQWTEPGRSTPAKFTLWSLDAAKGEWSRRLEQKWPWPITVRRCYASRTQLAGVGLDEQRGLLVMTQNFRKGTDVTQHTWVMKLDVSKLPAAPAPEWKPGPPEAPQAIPADDPKWVKTLRDLPANTWKYTRAHRLRRDWGNVGCDPVRGWIAYFGGGHSTYQVNDVAIYQPGANKWSFAAGDHNDFIPPTGWGGAYMGFRGGKWAHHQRNQYQLIDGRMYTSVGGGGLAATGTSRGYIKGMAWWYDIDRGGVWRMKRVAMHVAKDAGKLHYPPNYGSPHMADPSGKLVSLQLMVGYRYDRNVRKCNFASYDIYRNKLAVVTVPKPWPGIVGESRPWCLLPDKQQIFYFEWRQPRKKDQKVTPKNWMYDIKTNRFTELKPKRIPAGRCEIVVYLEGHNAIFATVSGKPWVYSCERNAWAELPVKGDRPYFNGPYGQVDYVKRHGVLVNVPGQTVVMRPDLSRIKWGK